MLILTMHTKLMITSLFLVYLQFLEDIKGQNFGSFSDIEKLYTDLLTSYNSDLRAARNFSNKTKVEVQMNVVNVHGFDEVAGKFSIYATLEITWIDFRMKWNPSLYGGVDEIVLPQQRVWKPNLTLMNPYGQLETIGHDETIVRYSNNGDAYWIIGGLMESSCDADVNYFPFDRQTCNMCFSPWGYKRKEVRIRPAKNEVVFDPFYSPNGIWKITGTYAETGLIMDFRYINFVFNFERRSTYFIINAFLPILLLALLQTMVFALPASSGERIGYAITCLLAIAVLLTIIVDNLPKTANPVPLLCFFLMADLVLATLICCFTILSLRFHLKDESNEVPGWLQRVERLFKCKNFKSFYRKKLKHKMKDLICCSRREPSTTKVEQFSAEINHNYVVKRKSVVAIDKYEGFDVECELEKMQRVTWTSVASTMDIVFFIFGNFCTILLVIIYLAVAV